VGRGLLASAEDVLRSSGATSVQVGADPPWWLYPGVPSSSTALLCLLEASGYQRVDTTFDMAVPLPVDDGSAAVAEGVVLGGTSDRDELDRWLAAEWPGWRTEALRALERSTLVLRRDASGIAGFCAWSVSRDGVLGPVAVRGSLVGRGVGRALVVQALRHMASEGRSVAEVGWVGPIRPYAAVGGHVSRLFFVYRKSLRP
jgi:GNAT superfamily N-acetyltransferase